MKNVRRPLVAALTLFTAAVVIDRVGSPAGEVMAWRTYALALLALSAPLALPALRRARPWLAAGAAVVVLALAPVGGGSGLFGGESVYVSVTSSTFVALAGILGHRLARGLDQVDQLLTAAAVGESPAIDLSGPAAANEIYAELARSRRHDRPLSVTVITPTPRVLEKTRTGPAIEVSRAIRTRFLFGSLARTVARQLRRSDLLFEHRPGGRLVILSPETDDAGMALLVDRIRAATDQAGIQTAAATASFPEDGVAFEALVESAEERLDALQEPLLRVVGDGGRP